MFTIYVSIVCLVLLVCLLIGIGALIEAYINCQVEKDQLQQANNTMAQIIREANIQDVAPKKIKD